MDYNEAEQRLKDIHSFMDESMMPVIGDGTQLQAQIYKVVVNELLLFDTLNGRLNPDYDFRKRILLIENRINEILGNKSFIEHIGDFTASFDEIQSMNISLHSDYNDIKVAANKLTPIRKLAVEQTTDALTKALAANYVQPVKDILIRQAVTGAGISETIGLIDNWNDGDFSGGKYTQGTPAPNLKQYATQIARDSAYGLHRNYNNIVKDSYGLDSFLYVGNAIKDSRPLCKHLVALKRKIKLSEIPALVKEYPEGLYPDTDKDNFLSYCGGYNCRHQAFATK